MLLGEDKKGYGEEVHGKYGRLYCEWMASTETGRKFLFN